MNEDNTPLPRHELVFDIEQALRKARSRWPRKRVPGQTNPLRPVAEAIVEHLELCRIRFFRLPPRRLHSSPPMRPDQSDP